MPVIKQATEVEKTISSKRATSLEPAEANKRAGAVEKISGIKRAAGLESTKKRKRASVRETTAFVERAEACETTNVNERDSQFRTLKLLTKNLYDLQLLRMQAAGRHNRTTGPETQLDEADLAHLREHSGRIAEMEKVAEKEVRHHLKTMPFYREVLGEVGGIGVPVAAVIMSMFDIHKADTVSKMWAFAGLRPMPCRRCRQCQNVVTEKDGQYAHGKVRVKPKNPDEKPEDALPKCSKAGILINEAETFESGRSQRPTKGEKLPYSAFLRAKLLGGFGSAFIKNNTQPWRKLYDDYKHRKLTAGWGVSDGHRHAAATRYATKMMLLHVWKAWREFEGLPVRPSYHEEKQGGHGFNGR